MEDNSRGLDLFGDPVPVSRDKAGRPEHVWTQENSNKINLMFAMGYKPKDIAPIIGVTGPTLRKHYFSELAQWKVAKLRLKAKQLLRLNEAAQAGNIAAIKELFKQMDKGSMLALADKVANRGHAERKPAEARLGKKEERSKAAHEVTGKFAPPPAPGGLLN